MEEPATPTLHMKRGLMTAAVERGELTSLRREGTEYMHHPEAPGWGHSDTEMFPVIGPTSESAYRVQVPRGNAMLDQHGLLRELEYSILSASETEIQLEKQYTAGTPVPNSKYPERSQLRYQLWPYSFRLSKKFALLPDGIRVSFEIQGERDMPFMFGYHPAFRITSPTASVSHETGEIGLSQIMAAGDRALEVPDCEVLSLEDSSQLMLESSGFGHFMLWSPDAGMLCAEPITFYPYRADPGQLHEGFQYLGEDPQEFALSIRILNR